jgi:hypothetical protein
MGVNTLEAQLLARVADMQPILVNDLLAGVGEQKLLMQIQLGIMLQEGTLVINDGYLRLPLRIVGVSPAITRPDGPNAKAYAELVAEENDLTLEELTLIARENGEYDVDAS